MGFLKFFGCLVKLVLGLSAFVAGGIAVFVLGTPYSLGKTATALVVDGFNGQFEGRLEVSDAHVFDLFRSQRLRSVLLRDPEGRTVAEGSITAGSLTQWGQSQLEVDVDVHTANLVREADGRWNFERALQRRGDTSKLSATASNVKFNTDEASMRDALRELLKTVRTVDVQIASLMIEDRTLPGPALVEARELALSFNRTANGSTCGILGRVAGGRLEVEAELDPWGSPGDGPRITALDVRLDDASSHAFDPWLGRSLGIGPLAEHLGPTLGELRLVAHHVEDHFAGEVRVRGNGVSAHAQGRWTTSTGLVTTHSEGGLELEFQDDSRFGRTLVPCLLPFVAELVVDPDAAGARSSLEGEAFTFPCGGSLADLTGRATLRLASRQLVPASGFAEVGELADLVTWTIADEPIPLVFEDGAVQFEVAQESQYGAWVVFGRSALAGDELDVSLRLPMAKTGGAEPTTVRILRTDEDLAVERSTD